MCDVPLSGSDQLRRVTAASVLALGGVAMVKKIVASETTGQVYHGVFPWDDRGGDNGVSPTSLKQYLEAVGRTNVAWVTFSQEWRTCRKFPVDTVRWIKDTGAAPYIRLMLRSSEHQYVCEPVFTLKAIDAGEFDKDFHAWGKAAAVAGVPLICEWGTEMNGCWFPWNAAHNGGKSGAELFKRVFRHIVSAIRSGGDPGITWVYHVNHESKPKEGWNAHDAYDPGLDFAEWVGVSLYGAQNPTDKEEDYPKFVEGMDAFLGAKQAQPILKDRPVMISEFGFTQITGEPPGRAAALWAQDALEALLTNHWPQVRGFSWWNESWENEPIPAEMRVQNLDPLKETFRSRLEKHQGSLVEAPIMG
jgi:hypothetical protein